MQYLDDISPMDWMYGIRIVEFQVSMFLLAGINEITIVGEEDKIKEVRKLMGDGDNLGKLTNYCNISSGISFYGKGKYKEGEKICSTYLERGVIVFGIGNRSDLFDASCMLKLIDKKMGENVYDLHEIALRRGMISSLDFEL